MEENDQLKRIADILELWLCNNTCTDPNQHVSICPKFARYKEEVCRCEKPRVSMLDAILKKKAHERDFDCKRKPLPPIPSFFIEEAD
jgi:histidinol phosphatase-like enzyme